MGVLGAVVVAQRAELDAIARIVSIIFLTCYGFLNLVCAVESMVSPDFRPQFKIWSWVSILGAICCFVLMVKFDPAAETFEGDADANALLTRPDRNGFAVPKRV